MTDRLRELDAAASPAPWTFSTKPQPNGCPIIGSKGVIVAMLGRSIYDEPKSRDMALADAEIITSLRNDAKKWAALADAADDLLQKRDESNAVYSAIESEKNFDAVGFATAAWTSALSREEAAANTLRSALAELKGDKNVK